MRCFPVCFSVILIAVFFLFALPSWADEGEWVIDFRFTKPYQHHEVFGADTLVAQTFRVPSSGTITAVAVRIASRSEKVFATIEVQIRDASLENILATRRFTVTLGKDRYSDFTLPLSDPCVVNKDEGYALVLEDSSSPGTPRVEVAHRRDDIYPRGAMYISHDGGSSWNSTPKGRDIIFGVRLAASSTYSGDDVGKSKEIRGYGDYRLESSISQLDLDDFSGPEIVGGFEDDFSSPVYSYTNAEAFKYDLGSTPDLLGLVVLEGRVEMIVLRFPRLANDFESLDDVGHLVHFIRGSILKNYDRTLVKWDNFHFTAGSGPESWKGFLLLKDPRDNSLLLQWDGYELTIYYRSSKFANFTLGYFQSEGQPSDSGGKL